MQNYLTLLSFIALLSACEPPGNTSTVSPSTTDAAQQTNQSIQSKSERLNEWFAAKFEEELQMSPMRLTRLGRKDRYDEFDVFTEAEADSQLAWRAETVADLESRFSYDALDQEAKTSYDLWIYQYEQGLKRQEFRRRNYVFTQMMGPQATLAQFLITFHTVDDESDMVAYIKRIGGVSTAIANLLERARIHAGEGVRPPAFAYEGVIVQATNLVSGAPFLDSGENSPVWSDAQKKIAALLENGKISEVRAKALREETTQALLTQFQPSYEALIAWFNSDLDNTDAIAKGAGNLPGGKAYYDHLLRMSTTTDLSASEIHEIGLREVARITDEMETVKARIGFQGGLLEFFDYLKKDDQFFFPNDDEGRQDYIDETQTHLAAIGEILPDYFGIMPRAGLIVKRVEAFREQDGGAQHYFRGTPDGSRPGIYYAHLSDMRAMPKGELEGVAYHEGNPGHHMQISIAQELTSIPQFRTLSSFTAYVEGWGLYAELLAKEMGGYQDEYSDFGRLTNEMWRAVRLVVDTGLHSKGWTEQGAIAYFKKKTPVTNAAVRSEVRRYMAWPGQATAYKIGMMKILELREYARQELGERFDIRAFHDNVLGGGALPLTILEQRIKRWVTASR